MILKFDPNQSIQLKVIKPSINKLFMDNGQLKTNTTLQMEGTGIELRRCEKYVTDLHLFFKSLRTAERIK